MRHTKQHMKMFNICLSINGYADWGYMHNKYTHIEANTDAPLVSSRTL
ncbi:hypothetical protein VCR31J2_1700002 [Vibrio coralliirubri]|uniref:Uncharacterized protein n=1 Tax=Vibrio coralliirubri TaxID=1516159 RepID=A0AA87C0K7_9VIBR|nr:hypothetical protein VCR31J2_1700002 [Vibrio coralliirubri]